ncbi:hypothetical protein [Citrobacter rodentium]|jgi:hypothetical protein|nr:hypothetical protein [Citrobacter rodentium]UHO29796.1 hypothetical protein K7R23_17475 [Citrobacter rodentium NBRC 105723 = DSM 16636]HAT8012666.1 hypothetical protein [Citrobacter rodentium NBRC 105723 = DSM 16636]HAT8016674.1 hypothetical protein [Citrobacter rodentium]HAT8027504.1 hypothetical protein [Citrobacter rodentium]HAT8035315.1 hypothetical protein [Citrobacter rodentium]
MNNSNNKYRVSILPASISLVDEYGRTDFAKNEISRALFAQLLIDFSLSLLLETLPDGEVGARHKARWR